MLPSLCRPSGSSPEYSSVASAFALIAVFVSGCADQGPALPQAEGYRSVRVVGRSAADPSGEMLAVGCAASVAWASPTAVRIMPRPGKPDVFECGGVAPDSIGEGIRRYLAATVAASGDAFLMAGEWRFEAREYCYASGGWWQADGTFYLPPSDSLHDCFWMDTMTFVPAEFSGEWPRIPIPPGGVGVPGTGAGGPTGGPLVDENGDEYCPNSNPNCLLALRSADSAKISLAFSKVVSSNSICQAALQRMQGLFALHHLYRGNPEIADDPAEPHDGQSRAARSRTQPYPITHVDQGFLESSTPRALAALLLHEAWHLLGHPNHAEGDDGPIYTTYPYNQAEGCTVE